MMSMDWLLVIIVFDLQGSTLLPRQIVHKAYGTEAACNSAGRNFRSIVAIPEGRKSISLCVTRDWFDQSGWQRLELGQ